MADMQNAYVKLDKVSKIYQMGEVEIKAVDEISFEISKGEFVVIVGPSGAGKTTVLNILGGMDTATKGTVLVDGKNITDYNSRQLTAYRRDDIGFVFQFYNLVPNLTALENVELAMQICKKSCFQFFPFRDFGRCKLVHLCAKTDHLPNPQVGKVQTLQFRQSPPSPYAATSSSWISSPAASLGRTRSKTVRFAYITQPGSPITGIHFPSFS